MRLHHLSMTGFGPFAGTQEVDFDLLGAEGLHLIHGPTGSGKTTILDAICFALYNGLPGSRAGAKDTLRCAYTDASTPTEVCVELTAAGRRLRVSRAPEYQRAKRRGHGTTRSPHRVRLEELRDDEWRVVSTSADEVSQQLLDAVGMGREQFAQVVVLPQGAFSEFLRARPVDRQQLLGALFDVQTYEQVQAWLHDHRRTMERSVESGRQQIHSLLEQIVSRLVEVDTAEMPLPDLPEQADDEPAERGRDARWLHREDEPPATWSDEAAAQAPTDLLPVLELLQEQLAAATATEARADARCTLLAARAESSSRRDAEVRRGLDATLRRQQLDAGAAHAAQLQTRLAQARAVAPIRPLLHAHEQAAASLADAERTLQDAEARCPRPWRPDAVEQLRSDVERLQGLVEAEREHARLTDLLEQRQTQLTEATQTAHDLATGLDKAEGAFTALQSRLRQLGDTTTAVHDAERLRQDVEACVDVLKALRQTCADTDQARTAAQSAHEAWSSARRAGEQARLARLEQLAGRLSLDLEPGSPCPVCGSPEHPDPAAVADEVVTDDDVEQAELLEDAARQRADLTGHELTTLVARRDTQRAELLRRLGDLTDSPAVDTDLERLAQVVDQLAADARARCATAQQAELERARDQAQAGRLSELIAHAQAEVTSAQETRAAAQSAVATLTTQRDDACVRLASGRADHAGASRDLAWLLASAEARDGGPQVGDRTAHDRASVAAAVGSAADEPSTGDAWEPWSPEAVLRATRGLLSSTEQLAAAHEAAERAQAQAEESERALMESLAEHDLHDLPALRAALLPEVETARLEQSLRERQDALAQVNGILSDESVLLALHSPADDHETISRLQRQARTEASEARASAEHLDRTTRALRDLRRRLQHELARLGNLDAWFDVVRRVDEAASGRASSNELRMTLTSFVLAARLEEVTAAANHRLEVMTDGRFRLLLDTSPAAGGARSGLGVQVEDLWSSTTRETSSLSGGEAFMASLALALGLSDVVSQHAGGLTLGTLFVDEGFGSLDDASLEHVLAVLDDLRAGGRCVGVVSHVDDLRQRIPAQVVVTKTESGSTLCVVTRAGAPAA